MQSSQSHGNRATSNRARSAVPAGREVIDGFVVMGLPRSRTAWLSKFLSYSDWTCGHEELIHARTLDDIAAWFSQPCTGTVETAAAPWWRLLDRFAPGVRIVIVRRDPVDVADSLARLRFDRGEAFRLMMRLDRKLDQIEARMDCLSVRFEELADEAVCARVFEYCLPYAHDHTHWARWAPVNVQIDMRKLARYAEAYRPAFDKLAAIAKHQTLAAIQIREPVAPDGVTFQVESFEDWARDGLHLIDSHLVEVGEAPGGLKTKNLPFIKQLADAGAIQFMTARSNGRMFGYLATVIGPSLESPDLLMGAHTTFYASEDVPGLGLKLQRAALVELRKRGVNDIHFQAGVRGSGRRIGAIYRRLGAEEAGEVYRLKLTGT